MNKSDIVRPSKRHAKWQKLFLSTRQYIYEEDGFILLEILCAIAILAILSTVIAFSTRRLSQQLTLDQFARQVKTDFMYAQQEAIRLHTGAVIQLDRASPSYQIILNGTHLVDRNSPDGIEYKWNTLPFNTRYLLYDSHGRTSSGGQLAIVNSYGDVRDIVFYMQSGQIKVQPFLDTTK